MAFEDPTQHPIRVAADLAAGTAVFASIMQWLTPALTLISLTLGIAWFILQIWESKTTQGWVMRWRAKHNASRLAKLRAKEKILAARIMAVAKVLGAEADAAALLQHAKIQAATDVKEDGLGSQ